MGILWTGVTLVRSPKYGLLRKRKCIFEF